jgi:hypothetical protein
MGSVGFPFVSADMLGADSWETLTPEFIIIAVVVANA